MPEAFKLEVLEVLEELTSLKPLGCCTKTIVAFTLRARWVRHLCCTLAYVQLRTEAGIYLSFRDEQAWSVAPETKLERLEA